MATVFRLESAAQAAGISEGLLHLWIATGKFKPSGYIALTSNDAPKGSVAARALASYAGAGEQVFGWARYSLTDAEVERLRGLVEETATSRTKAEATHAKGSHYSVAELAALWGMGVDKIRELFANEPDVLKISKPSKKGRRAYVTLRIPENVAARVQRRLS